MNNMNLVGRRVRNLRKQRGMTQEKLARNSHIGVKYLSRIERGDTNITVRLLSQLAGALEVELFELLEIRHVRERDQLEQEIFGLVQKANDEKIRLLYRLALMT